VSVLHDTTTDTAQLPSIKLYYRIIVRFNASRQANARPKPKRRNKEAKNRFIPIKYEAGPLARNRMAVKMRRLGCPFGEVGTRRAMISGLHAGEPSPRTAREANL